MEKTIEGERAYPIYRFIPLWNQLKKETGETIKNGTFFSIMKTKELSPEEIEEFKKEWWKKYSEAKLEGVSPVLLDFSHIVYYETWNLTWFSHETFDVGQSNEEALASFERYVMRHEGYQKDIQPGQISLMGAEDRWRWRGADTKEGSTTPAPCRCEGCKKAGMIRINH